MLLLSLVTVTLKAALNSYTQCLLASSISTTYEGMEVKISENIWNFRNGISAIPEGTVSRVKLKLTTPYTGGAEQIKRQNMYNNSTASTPTTTTTTTIIITATTTTTRAKTTIINYTPTATTITNIATTTTNIPRGIQANILGNILPK